MNIFKSMIKYTMNTFYNRLYFLQNRFIGFNINFYKFFNVLNIIKSRKNHYLWIITVLVLFSCYSTIIVVVFIFSTSPKIPFYLVVLFVHLY